MLLLLCSQDKIGAQAFEMTKEKLPSSSRRTWFKSFLANSVLKAPAGSVDGSLFVYDLVSFTAGEIKCQLMPLKQQLGGRLSPEVTSSSTGTELS